MSVRECLIDARTHVHTPMRTHTTTTPTQTHPHIHVPNKHIHTRMQARSYGHELNITFPPQFLLLWGELRSAFMKKVSFIAKEYGDRWTKPLFWGNVLQWSQPSKSSNPPQSVATDTSKVSSFNMEQVSHLFLYRNILASTLNWSLQYAGQLISLA